jgi:hypothetical protein
VGAPHQAALAIDGCVQSGIDTVEEVLRMLGCLEADDIAAEQALDDLVAIRQAVEPSRIGPRDVPETDDGGIRQAVAQHLWQQREVIVLHEDDRPCATGLGDDSVGEAPIHVLVVPPVVARETRRLERDVAERPQRAVGEAVVVAPLFATAQPDAPQRIRASVAGDLHSVLHVHHGAIRTAGSVRDPRAARRQEHGIERADETAHGPGGDDRAMGIYVVDARLAVGNHDQSSRRQVAFEGGGSECEGHSLTSRDGQSAEAVPGGCRGCC